MGKVRFMAEEFFRSFRKNIVKDLLMMIIFAICFVMLVLMGSYSLDLGERYAESAQYYDEKGIWYKAGLEILTDRNEVLSNLDTLNGCRNVMAYYEKLRNMEKHPVMSAMTAQTMLMKESVITEKFGEKNYNRFLNEDNQDSFMTHFGNEDCNVLDMKSSQLDFRAYQLFGLKTEDGEGFTEANTTLRRISDTVPVILGNEYKGVFSVGDRVDIAMTGTDYIYPCTIIGILEKGTQVPEYGYITQDMLSLDSYIIFPYGIRVLDDSQELDDMKKYAFLDMTALENSAVQVADEKEFNELVLLYRDIGLEFGLPPIRLFDASMGLNLLRRESALSVRIMLILTIVLLCFIFYSFFIAFYDKVQSGRRVYGIYLMNGCSIGMILLPCLFEAAIILFPSILVCRWVFTYDNVGQGANIEVLMRVACCAVIASFLISSLFLVYLMRGVNTERLVRQKDL